jgi:RHS repeat-associated protein
MKVNYLLDGLYVICEFSDSGNLVSSSGSVSQPYEYLSFYSEGEIGLYLTGKRWYDPDIGRYISRNSPYLFSNNNPVSPLPVYTPPISDITTPKEPKGLFPYGNWCGAGWSSGRYTDNPEEVDWSVPAIDSIDQCCKEHDWCVQHENNWWDKWVGKCKEDMCRCLRERVKECDINRNPEASKGYKLMEKLFCIFEPPYVY